MKLLNDMSLSLEANVITNGKNQKAMAQDYTKKEYNIDKLKTSHGLYTSEVAKFGWQRPLKMIVTQIPACMY